MLAWQSRAVWQANMMRHVGGPGASSIKVLHGFTHWSRNIFVIS
jgi:hypothetical protein